MSEKKERRSEMGTSDTRNSTPLAAPAATSPHVLPAETPSSPRLDRKTQEAIGRSLKEHFNDVANAGVPDRFLTLLAELEAKERGRDH